MLSTLFLSFPHFCFHAPTALLCTYRAFIHPDCGSRLLPHCYATTALLYTLTAVPDSYRTFMHQPLLYTLTMVLVLRAFIHPPRFIHLPRFYIPTAPKCTYRNFMHLLRFYAPTCTAVLCSNGAFMHPPHLSRLTSSTRGIQAMCSSMNIDLKQ